MTSPVTRIRDHAASKPEDVALRDKTLGVWHEWTWAAYWDHVQLAGHAYLALGLVPGDRVAIHSENRPEWLIADMGALAARIASVGIYPTNPAAEVRYLLGDSGAKVIVVEDQEQLDKTLDVLDDCPELQRMVYLAPRGIRGRYTHERLMSWEEFLDLGRQHRVEHPDALTEVLAAQQGDDLATLIYTSGTTGPPKGAMLTVANVEFAIKILIDEGAFTDPPPGSDDLSLSYLPLSHVAERIFTTWFNAAAATQVNFAESIETVPANLREVQPTILFGVPRIWEKLLAGVETRLSGASWFKRKVARFWLGVADRIGQQLVANGGQHTSSTRLLYGIGWVFFYRALKDRLGMRKVRYAASGAAPIAPEVLRFFMGIGVPMHEVYGMTENTAVATGNRPGRVKLGTVGEAHPGIEVRIDEETGEILTRHGAVFAGYWKKPEDTAEVLSADGWLRTGDVGEWVEGTHLKITDRMKDIIITAGGKNISPSQIENELKASPYIREAIVIGDGRKFLCALIGIELETAGDWAQRKQLGFSTYRDLTEKPEIVALIADVVKDVNTRLAQVEQVKEFRLLPKELDHEDGELTATQKVKRSAISDMFSDTVTDMYAGEQPMTDFLEVIIRGLGSGSIYALLALGFVIIYKSTGVISFAQPALMLSGAVITSYVAPALGFVVFAGLSFFVSMTAAALLTAILALILERVAIRPMVGQAAFVVAIITIGLDIAIRVVASGFIGTGARPVPNPWGLKRTELLGLQVQERHLVSLAVLLVIVSVLFWFYRYTRYGLAMRAAAFDQEAALTQGVSVGSVFALSWALAGVLAAVAGTLLATSAGVDRQLWIVALVALPAIILGGLDSLEGAVIGGLAVGVVESLVGSYQRDYAPWLGDNFALVSAYALMLVVLLAKPYGIFGTPEVRRV